MKKLLTPNYAVRLTLILGLAAIVAYLLLHVHEYGWQYVILNSK